MSGGIGPIPVLVAVSSPGGTPIIAPTMTMAGDNLPVSTVGLIVGNFAHVYDPTSDSWNRESSGSATADALVPDALGNTRQLAQLFGYNGATFDRIRALENNADGIATQIGNVSTMAFAYGFNGATFDRIRALDNNADGLAASVGNLAALTFSYGFNGATFDRLWSIGSNTDAVPAQTSGQQSVAAQLYGWNGTSFDRVRLANVSNTVVATAAGATPVWTPSSGKKFRLLGYTIDVAGTMAATGVQTLQLQDDATTFKNHLAEVIETTTVSISNSTTNIGADLGQGYLSTAADNVLNLVLGTDMATGGVAINVWGTEE